MSILDADLNADRAPGMRSEGRSGIQVRRLEPVKPVPEEAPPPVLLFVARQPAPVQVYVSTSVMRTVWEAVGRRCHSCGQLNVRARLERGGALAGRYGIDAEGQRFIVITDALAAPDAPSSGSHITIRAEDWLDINARIGRSAGARLLGWFHSHPRLGVQMSGTDRDTQRRFFGADWQVGLVVDPHDQSFQFHVGPGAEPARWLAFIDVASDDAPTRDLSSPERPPERRLKRKSRGVTWLAQTWEAMRSWIAAGMRAVARALRSEIRLPCRLLGMLRRS